MNEKFKKTFGLEILSFNYYRPSENEEMEKLKMSFCLTPIENSKFKFLKKSSLNNDRYYDRLHNKSEKIREKIEKFNMNTTYCFVNPYSLSEDDSTQVHCDIHFNF